MPIRPDDAAQLTAGIRDLYAEAEVSLLQRTARALAAGQDTPDWVEQKLRGIQALTAQADEIIRDLWDELPGATERAVDLAYNRGIATAGGDLRAAGAAGAVSGAFGQVQPTGAVAAIVTDTMQRLTPMQFQIRRNVADVYQQVVTQAAAQTTLGTMTRRDASAQILTRLAGQGVTGFRDAAGRNWNMGSYAEMAARTSAANAMLQGHTDRIRDLGIDTVIVSDAPEECKLCRPYEGKVLSLSGATTGRLSDGRTVTASLSEARGRGLYHPNCRHTHTVYLPGITKPHSDTEDAAGDKIRQQQRAYERRIRELKRQEAVAREFGGPGATLAAAKLRAKTAEFREWREEHGRKNLSYRTSIAGPKPEQPPLPPGMAPTPKPVLPPKAPPAPPAAAAPEPAPAPAIAVGRHGDELADSITYDSTLHMSDGDLAEMMSEYADDPAVFDKIMEVMDERDARHMAVTTKATGATVQDAPEPQEHDWGTWIAGADTTTTPTARKTRNLSAREVASEEYQNYTMTQYNNALNDLNGVLLNEKGKAAARAGRPDLEIDIFAGSAVTARKYASEELLQWWTENGRETLGSFRFKMYGWDIDRKAAQTVRTMGYERGQAFRDRSNF